MQRKLLRLVDRFHHILSLGYLLANLANQLFSSEQKESMRKARQSYTGYWVILPVPELRVEHEKQQGVNQGRETDGGQVLGGAHLSGGGEEGDEGHQYCQHVDHSAGGRDQVLQLQDQ